MRRPLPPRRRGSARLDATRRAASPLSPARASPVAARDRRPRLASFEDVVALARAKRDIQLVEALERDVRLARFEPGSIAFSPVEGASSGLAQTLARRLQEWTGERWMVALVAGSTAPTLREAAEAREAERASGAAAHPLVRKVLERFHGRPHRRRAAPRARAAPAGA